MTEHCAFPLARRMAAVGLLLSATVPAAAETPPPNSTVVIEVGGSQSDPYELPAVAAGSGGSFVVAWRRTTADGDSSVHARTFDASLQPRGPAFQVSGDAADEPAASAAVAALPDGRFLVAWSEPVYSVFSDRVMARLLGAGGQPLGVPQPIGAMDEAGYWPGPPALAVEAAGTVLAAWSRHDRIVVQRFAPAGDALLPVGAAIDAGQGAFPSVAVVPAGFAVAALRLAPRFWQPGGSPSGHCCDAVVVRVFNADGSARGAEHVFAGLPDGETLAVRLTADAVGRVVAAWYERDPISHEWYDRIRAQRFTAEGATLGPAFDLVTGEHWDLGNPRGLLLGDLASRKDGGLLLHWSRGEVIGCVTSGFPPADHPFPGCANPPSGEQQLARRFSADGSPDGETLTLGPGAFAHSARVATTPGGWIALHDGAQLTASRLDATACPGDPAAPHLCIAGRFRVEAGWETAARNGSGEPISLAADTGGFWFFSPSNLELTVKVLDGTAVNGHHWVFFASLTDVEFDLTVVDHATGERRTYHNPAGTMASRADVTAFTD